MRFTWSTRAGQQLLRLDAEARDRFFQRLAEELAREERKRPPGPGASGILTFRIPAVGKTRVRRLRRSVRIISVQLDPGAGES
jgi:hypothetical protein